MAKKLHKEASEFADTVKESAQQIWLAGLGAFSKAQEEGGKVFDTLVKEGVAIQRRTQAAAEEKFGEASSRMASMADELSAKASDRWEKLEGVFEERVSRALKKMGVPLAHELEELSVRVDDLHRKVASLAGGNGSSRTTGRSARKTAAKRPAAKAAAKRAPARKAAG